MRRVGRRGKREWDGTDCYELHLMDVSWRESAVTKYIAWVSVDGVWGEMEREVAFVVVVCIYPHLYIGYSFALNKSPHYIIY